VLAWDYQRGVHHMDSDLQRIGRREWWLWLSALTVTLLSGIAYLLSSFPGLFLNKHFFELSSDQTRWVLLNLLLLFNTWLVYRMWLFRRMRKQLNEQTSESSTESVYDPNGADPVTGFYTRASVDQRLGKEVARARRRNIPLSLVAIHLDDFGELNERYGSDVGNQILVEFANRLRKATRGCDFCARLGSNVFVVVLPECSVSEAKIVSERLDTSELECAGREFSLTYSVEWIDYKPGEVPSDLLKRATDVLKLYHEASKHADERLQLS
jgi:diguanylate cyclase (GGDEF)-like protein